MAPAWQDTLGMGERTSPTAATVVRMSARSAVEGMSQSTIRGFGAGLALGARMLRAFLHILSYIILAGWGVVGLLALGAWAWGAFAVVVGKGETRVRG